MNRGGPLQRHTPLARTPLARGVDLIRITPLRRSNGALPVRGAAEPGERSAETLARKHLRDRSQGHCELRIGGVCLGRTHDQFCHRLAEGQGGPWLASNGIAGCGSGTTGCHGWCHDNPALAEAHGWIVAPTYRMVDGMRIRLAAEAFPAFLWRPDADEPDWVWLDDTGGAVTVDQIADVELYELMAGEVTGQ